MYLSLLLLAVVAASSSPCSFTASNASYDLQPLTISSQSPRQYHLVHDADPNRNYSYYFNLCEPVHSMPLEICSNSSKRPAFAQGYCKPPPGISDQSVCPKTDIVPITGNGICNASSQFDIIQIRPHHPFIHSVCVSDQQCPR